MFIQCKTAYRILWTILRMFRQLSPLALFLCGPIETLPGALEGRGGHASTADKLKQSITG